MAKPVLKVVNWSKHQHYKDRCPPWIKLYIDVFQDYDFAYLSDTSKLLLICIWTLAGRSSDGSVPADLDYIKHQGNLGDLITTVELKELIDKGFLEDASNVIASCKQLARERQSRDRAETENTLDFEKKSAGCVFCWFFKSVGEI